MSTPAGGLRATVYGSVDYDAEIGPGVVIPNLQQAIMVNPFDTTGSSCWDPSNGCAPYNLFGFGGSSQEALVSPKH